jgi:FKBP-type peptidyl-prolyl cis-trans isomerase FklB
LSALAALLLLAAPVTLPGISYEVLGSGSTTAAHPTRADEVDVRYVGRLTDGTVFSASPDQGKGISTFDVQRVIPGFMAAVLLMRPGDRWRVTLPPYLAYGAPGRSMGPQASAMQSHDIPPNATLIFDIELVAIRPKKP